MSRRGGVLIACIYLLNGNPQPGPKFDYKLAWFDRLIAHAAELHAAGVPAVLAGDYTVVPTDPDQILGERCAAAAGEPGGISASPGPALHPLDPMYTFWDYKRNRWPRNAGLWLDHLLLSPPLATCLVEAGVNREIRGQVGASDHAPAWVVLGQ